jgi:hypothetical protein
MAGYVYGGNEFDAVPKRGPKAGKLPFNPSLCGTTPGVSQHKRLKESNCTKCADWYNAQRRARWAKKGKP